MTKITLMPLDFITMYSAHLDGQDYATWCTTRQKVEANLEALRPEELAAFRKTCEEYETACAEQAVVNGEMKTQRDRVLTTRAKIKKEKAAIASYHRKIAKAESEVLRLEEVKYGEHVQTMNLFGKMVACGVEGRQKRYQAALLKASQSVEANQQKLEQLRAIEAQMAELKAQHDALLRS